MKCIITTVQYSAGVNKNLLRNIKAFAKDHGVDQLLTFVQNGSYKSEDIVNPEVFKAGFNIVDDSRLNANLWLKDCKILSSQINPMTGLSFKLSRDYSYILPSPKIRYLSVASARTSPRALMTTGAMTHGNYRLNTAQGRKAALMHQYGFVYVEVINQKIFRAYQVEATKRGDFHYKTERYYSGKQVRVQPEALILGDWHTGDTDRKVRKRTIEMIEKLNPKRVIFHDLFNGHSVNHHEKANLLASLKGFQRKRDSLMKEIQEVHREISFFGKMFPHVQFVVAESNHDIFLYRYLDSKEFMDSAENFLFAIKLIPEILKDKRPTLEIALSLIGRIPSNFRFLKEDEEYRVRGIELGYHGHRGANGSRGTASQFDRLNLKMITGHMHTPQILNNGMVVGTSTKLRLDYTKGATSWMHSHGILYKDGKYGLLTII